MAEKLEQGGSQRDSDEILARADALINRHSRAPATSPAANDAPARVDTAATAVSDDDDVPLLTDIVTPATTKEVPLEDAVLHETEVISRVQNQNIEHTAYLRVMSQVDDRITNVVRQRVMPEIGSALDQALARITNDLKT